MSNTMTLSCGVGDCYAGFFTGLTTGSTTAFVAGSTGHGDDDVRNWIPFTVSLPKSLAIVSATLRIVAAASESMTPVGVNIGCEAVDNASAPADGAAMFAKTMTAAKLNASLPAYVSGTEYSYVITSAVQEILNRSGWAYGNTMAVMIFDDGSTGGTDRRTIATSEHASLAEPKLDIVYNLPVPRGGGWF